ncbi:MAG TPA: hypothetical protein VHO26_13980 [Propionibacteriaceae bacterium]|nr:hypothetical protein [Propionibacteriaceae bacterium]
MKRWHAVSGYRRLAASGAIAVTATLGLAACGSSTSGTTSPSAGGTPAASSSGGAATISTASGQFGTYLTDGSGRAVYLWMADSGGKSTCTGACASAWPPVMTTGTPKASGSAMASDLGTTTRSDGGTQVTYAGHPLYYFIKDTGPDQTQGQGSNGFGAKWWILDPAGKAITGMHSSPASSASSSGSSGYGN